MQIRHLNGKAALYWPNIDGGAFRELCLTEDEVRQLLDPKEGLPTVLQEILIFNAKSKREKIDQLEAEIKRLKESMNPVPSTGLAIRVGGY
jgi:hypothetical protein